MQFTHFYIQKIPNLLKNSPMHYQWWKWIAHHRSISQNYKKATAIIMKAGRNASWISSEGYIKTEIIC